MQYKKFKTKAIVISEKEIGEDSKIFTLYTEKFGKIDVLGKGVRKIKGKLKSKLGIFNYIYLEFVKGRSFYIITNAKVLDEFAGIKGKKDNLDLADKIKKYREGLYVCELVNRLIKGEEKDEKVWNLLLETLKELDKREKSSSLAIRYFEWRFLSLLGFKPDLYNCMECKKGIKSNSSSKNSISSSEIRIGKIFFSVEEGRIVCQPCFRKRFEGNYKEEVKLVEVSKGGVKILRVILENRKDIWNKLNINPELEKELRNLSKHYIQYILEEELFVV